MASITVNLAPTIVSGTATVYPRSNWPATTSPSGAPVGSSVTSASVGASGAATFSGLTEGREYVAYQATPDRYVRFMVDSELGTPNDPESVESNPLAGDGRKVVTSAGTEVALASATACSWVQVTAETDNTGVIVVGASTVVAALSTRRGTPLNAGDSVTVPADDLANVYIDSTVNGDGVTFIYG